MSQRRIIPKSLPLGVSARWVPEAVLLIAGLAITLPLWVTSRPPVQDLPQHVAAVRVLSSFTDPSFRFQEYFELTLGRTQYLTVYLLAIPLAKIFGPTIATKCVLSLALVGTPLGMARLLRALGFDPWLALLGLPFVFNVHVAHGFLNFVAAIPMLFVGLALALEQQRCPTRRGQAWLAAVLLVCFFTHIVPFGLLLLAVAALSRWEKRALLRHALVILPSVFAMVYWLVTSPAGRVVRSLGRSERDDTASATHLPFGAALRMLTDWVIHISTGEEENLRLILWLVAVLLLLVLAVVFPKPDEPRDPGQDGEVPRRFGRLVVLLLMPLSMVAYFSLPNGYGFIWPICQRFPILAIWFGIPLLSRAPTWSVRLVGTLALTLAMLSAAEQARLFRATGSEGYRGFDQMIGQIPKGSRVATLVFERQLEGLQLSPLMHAAGWVQAERGGIVMFSFAEFPSSPFSYRAERRPPAVLPRWEWGPDRVVPDRDLGWYDYCLVQGWSGSLQSSRRFTQVSKQGRWSLWRRIGPADKNG